MRKSYILLRPSTLRQFQSHFEPSRKATISGLWRLIISHQIRGLPQAKLIHSGEIIKKHHEVSRGVSVCRANIMSH